MLTQADTPIPLLTFSHINMNPSSCTRAEGMHGPRKGVGALGRAQRHSLGRRQERGGTAAVAPHQCHIMIASHTHTQPWGGGQRQRQRAPCMCRMGEACSHRHIPAVCLWRDCACVCVCVCRGGLRRCEGPYARHDADGRSLHDPPLFTKGQLPKL